MSSGDYISKSDVIKIIEKETKRTNSYIEHNTQLHIKIAVEKLPTLDEKEIIRKPFERVVECLNEKLMNADLECASWKDKSSALFRCADAKRIAYAETIEIVKEECGINE